MSKIPHIDQMRFQPQPEVLLDALHRYQSGDCSKAELRTTFNDYQKRKTEAAQIELPQVSWAQSILKSFSWFSLFPHETYETYEITPPARLNQTSEEAIASHWRAAGGYLSYAMIHHILEEDETDGSEKK